MLLLDHDITQIIMVSYFRPNDFLKSVKSILCNTICPFNLSIIDNSHGGLDNELDEVNRHQNITIYKNDINLGKGAAFNKWYQTIMKNTAHDYFISIDADIKVTPGWLLELKRAHAAVRLHGLPGIIAPVLCSVDTDTFDIQLKNNMLTIHVFSDFAPIVYYNGLYYNKIIAGGLLLISRAFFNNISGYSEEQLYGGDDAKLCVAAIDQDRFIGINSNVSVTHLTHDDTNEYKQWKQQNTRIISTNNTSQCGHWD